MQDEFANVLSPHLSYPRSLVAAAAAAAAAAALSQVTPTKSVQSVRLNKDSGFLNLKTIWAVPSSAHRGRCLAENSGDFAPPSSQKLIQSHEENLESTPTRCADGMPTPDPPTSKLKNPGKHVPKLFLFQGEIGLFREGSERFLTFLSQG